ncbi:DUF3558 domain-containing protein [Lentzea sp. NPDC051838]|uniref:DUF3558 domain-containing protein n=1 Tax=Lentzea sp. NPDC051838 TaxID=3154849 RepID=UPI0034343693
MRRLVVPFVLAAVLTGCSTTEKGTPSAGNPTPTTGTSAGSAPVDRPKAVDMKTLDPCSLVTPKAKTTLGIRSAGSVSADADYGDGAKACGVGYEDTAYNWSINTIVNGGADRLKSTEGKERELTELKVAGYPAYLGKGKTQGTGSPQCEIYLDVHDGQLLLVEVNAPFGKDSALDGACKKVNALAEVVGTALATK